MLFAIDCATLLAPINFTPHSLQDFIHSGFWRHPPGQLNLSQEGKLLVAQSKLSD
jgi:hypothetical protein